MPNKLNKKIAQEIGARYPKGTDYLVVGWNKLTGIETTELRKNLRAGKVRMEVVKNTLAARSLSDAGIGGGAKFLQGPSALLTAEVEMPQMAKLVTELVKKYEERIYVRGGLMGDTVLTPDVVVKLASIPPMPVLQTQFISSVQAPVAQVAGAFQSITRSLACALEGIRKKMESSAPPAPPPPAASEPAPSATA
jgi:ribosomal protein L10